MVNWIQNTLRQFLPEQTWIAKPRLNGNSKCNYKIEYSKQKAKQIYNLLQNVKLDFKLNRKWKAFIL